MLLVDKELDYLFTCLKVHIHFIISSVPPLLASYHLPLYHAYRLQLVAQYSCILGPPIYMIALESIGLKILIWLWHVTENLTRGVYLSHVF